MASQYVPSVHFARNIYWESQKQASGNNNTIADYIQAKLPVKTTGAAINTGTNDTDFVTPKAMADADVNTRLKSIAISFTRDMTAATGDVSYIGTGFTPTAMIVFASVAGTTSWFIGAAGSNRTGKGLANVGNTAYGDQIVAINLQTGGSDHQKTTVKSWDANGFTLTWTKTGTPTGTGYISVICFR